MSQLNGLRARRDAALADRHLDIPLPGLDDVVARFRTLGVTETSRIATKYEKSKDREYANLRLTSESLALAFLGLWSLDGEQLSDGISDDLIAEFTGRTGQVPAADVIVAMFVGADGNDWPLFSAGGKLAEWSQSTERQVDEDAAGN